MLPRNIPYDINVEILLSYLPDGSYKTVLRGVHKRNSYKDIIEIDEKQDGTLWLGIGRNSLYNSLPEILFHPVDRFDNIPKLEEKGRFADEYQKQEEEKENAYRFFAPIDLLLLMLRMEVRGHISEYVDRNKILIEILCDRLNEEQRNNRFIKEALCFIPICKNIRGNKTLLTFMLRKILMEEGLKIDLHHDAICYSDESPKYADGLNGNVGECYVGNVFDERTTIYDIHYWSDKECNEYFLKFISDIDVFRNFIQDYFISVEERLCFTICRDDDPLRLSDDKVYNYLNYNTNL